MSIDNVKRFDRVVSLLIQLQSGKVITARELADRFEVSVRTIYRDIRSLEAAGVPISGEAGIGYSIMEGYRLPPVMFTREEASSFVAAEKLVQRFTDKTLGAYFESAMFKVKSVLRGREKDWVTTLENQITIHGESTLFNDNIPDALEILFESVGEKKQVALVYQSLQQQDPTQRLIEPVGIFHENNFWYILGYCHLRNDYRQFRTDRLIEIRRTPHSFTRQHGSVDEHRTSSENREMIKVRILVERDAARHIRNSRTYYGFVSEKLCGEYWEMTFLTHNPENIFARWYAMFGDHARILEPESLKKQVTELLGRTLKNLTS